MLAVLQMDQEQTAAILYSAQSPQLEVVAEGQITQTEKMAVLAVEAAVLMG